MTAGAQSKPTRGKVPGTQKKITPRRGGEVVSASATPTPSRRKTREAFIAQVTVITAPKPASGIRPKPGSKLGIVLGLLEKPQGVSLAKLVEVTGWLPHTTRAALTGLRKRGFAVVSEKDADGGTSVYRIGAQAA